MAQNRPGAFGKSGPAGSAEELIIVYLVELLINKEELLLKIVVDLDLLSHQLRIEVIGREIGGKAARDLPGKVLGFAAVGLGAGLGRGAGLGAGDLN